jgi:hypothetical protein
VDETIALDSHQIMHLNCGRPRELSQAKRLRTVARAPKASGSMNLLPISRTTTRIFARVVAQT